MKKKIGIISCFDMENVNFGNRLQAYALQHYIESEYPDFYVETLYFKDLKDYLRTKKVSLPVRIVKKIDRERLKLLHKRGISKSVQGRLQKFNDFSKRLMNIADEPMTWNKLLQTDFDIFICGSDIVWYQWRNLIRRTRFLDFEARKPFRKISYAASFGRDWIPDENVRDIKRCLKEFSGISVREKSSIRLLQDIGILGAVHAMDPTLLLRKTDWEKIEKKPKEILPEKYIFVYILGAGKEETEIIKKAAKKKKLKVVTIPDASGNNKGINRNFADLNVNNCSPDEWIWLIHNAEYIVTDSFHGIAFSTIFEKRFIAVRRKEKFDINNRLKDYLDTIDQTDKMIKLGQQFSFDTYKWDYKKIHSILVDRIDYSKEYLSEALRF